MIDFLGRELYDGDLVVALRYRKTSAELCKCEIIGFTNSFVRVLPTDSRNSFLISPQKVVRVETAWL